MDIPILNNGPHASGKLSSLGGEAAAAGLDAGSGQVRDAIGPWFRPLLTARDNEALIAAAATDNHVPLVPTHLVEKNGEIVGYGSVGAVPMLFVWVHSQKVSARESRGLLNLGENLMALQYKGPFICCPCTAESPFFPFMRRLGYQSVGEAGFFLKRIK